MIPLISDRHDPQFVPACKACPTASTVTQPPMTAAAICLEPTPKQEQTVAPLSTRPLPGRPATSRDAGAPVGEIGRELIDSPVAGNRHRLRRHETARRPACRRRRRRNETVPPRRRYRRAGSSAHPRRRDWRRRPSSPRSALANASSTRQPPMHGAIAQYSASRCCGLSRRTAKPNRAASKRATRAATCFKAGWPETGSVIAGTSASTRALRRELVGPVHRREQRPPRLARR